MTPEQTQELAALKAALKQHIEVAEKATPGPWDAEDPHDSYCGNPYCRVNGCPENHPSGEIVLSGPEFDGFQDEPNRMHPKDARFIATARTMSPIACRIALAGIEALEDDYNSQEYGRDKLGEQRLLFILNLWKGGNP